MTAKDDRRARVLGWLASGQARQARKDARISQVRAAREIGVSPDAVSRWERGVQEPRSAATVTAYHARLKAWGLDPATPPEPPQPGWRGGERNG
jgi:transcriptional regulator with XRE-family HTH domain